MTQRPTTTVINAATLGALDEAFFEPMALWSPLAQPIVDLMYAGVNDAVVPEADPAPTGELLEALELLLAPRFGCSVTFTRGTQGASVTLFDDEEHVVRFDRRTDYVYDMWGPVTVREAGDLLVTALRQGRPTTAEDHQSATLSTAAYFALSAWIAQYRELGLPAGLQPSDGVVEPDELTRYMASPEMLGMLATISPLGVPAEFATAFAQAPAGGIDELQRAGIVIRTGDGLGLTDPGATIVGPIAFPAMTVAIATVELATNRGASTTINAAPGTGITSIDALLRNDEWTFTLAALGDDQSIDAVAAALAPSDLFESPIADGEASWPTPLLDGLRKTFSGSDTSK